MAEEPKEAESIEEEQKTGSSMKPVIFVSLVVFVAATAGFAWMEGLFSPPPEAQTEVMAPESEDSTGTDAQPAGVDIPAEEQTLAQAASQARRKGPAAPRKENRETLATAATSRTSHEQEQWLKNEKRKIAQKRRELESKEAELERLRQEIEGLLAKVQENKSERITMMAKLYDSMDPDAVAQQISSMDDKTVLMLLPQMNTRTAAKVMAAIDPKRAAQITTKMLALDQ